MMRERLIEALRQRFPADDQARSVLRRPTLSITVPRSAGAPDLSGDADRVRRRFATPSSNARNTDAQLRDIIRRKRVTTLFQPIIRAREQRSSATKCSRADRRLVVSGIRQMLFQFARDAKAGLVARNDCARGCLKRLRDMDIGDRKFF